MMVHVDMDENETVYAIKEYLARQFDIFPSAIKLSCKGKQIFPYEILTECGVTRDTLVMASKY